MSSNDPRVDGRESAGLSRRTVLKAGAWATPVIMLATATPAASASGHINLKFTHVSAWYVWSGGTKTGMTFDLGIQAEGEAGASTQDVTLLLTVEAAGLSTAIPTLNNAPGWAATTPGEPAGQNMNYTILWTGTLPVNGLTGNVQITLAGNDLASGKAWQALATSQGAGSAVMEGVTTLRETNPEEPLPPLP